MIMRASNWCKLMSQGLLPLVKFFSSLEDCKVLLTIQTSEEEWTLTLLWSQFFLWFLWGDNSVLSSVIIEC